MQIKLLLFFSLLKEHLFLLWLLRAIKLTPRHKTVALTAYMYCFE